MLAATEIRHSKMSMPSRRAGQARGHRAQADLRQRNQDTAAQRRRLRPCPAVQAPAQGS
ncbi:hypothetical protein XOCgx_4233 [Xanthomonas oryzae pv. oryzicola]|nr:hypothetical protein XOCgx_4233 [Xanthomonas oryzae pv. oryzicola]